MEHIIAVCRCGDVRHQIVFLVDDEDNMCYMEVLLNKLPWYKRLIIGIKYIFGCRCRYGAFEEVVLDEEDASKFFRIAHCLAKIEYDNHNLLNPVLVEKLTDILDEVLANYLHGGDADYAIEEFRTKIEKLG